MDYFQRMRLAIGVSYAFAWLGVAGMFAVILVAITKAVWLSIILGSVGAAALIWFMDRSEDRRREWTVNRRKDKT